MNVDALGQAREVEGLSHRSVLASQVTVAANRRFAHDDAEIGAEAGHVSGDVMGCQQMADAILERFRRIIERPRLGLIRQDIQRGKPRSKNLDCPVERPGVEDASATRQWRRQVQKILPSRYRSHRESAPDDLAQYHEVRLDTKDAGRTLGA